MTNAKFIRLLLEWCNTHNFNSGINAECKRICGTNGPKAWDCSSQIEGCMNKKKIR